MFFDKNYLRNLGWQGMGNVSAQIINVVSLPIITRLFTPADIGMLRVFIEALAFTTIVISFRVEHIIMLPKRKNEAVELLLFVFSSGFISTLIISITVLILILFQLIPSEFFIWAIVLPFTSFLLVFSQASQQLSQRSGDFKKSGISEIVNRSTNSSTAIIAGILNSTGIALGLAVAVGFFFKALTFIKNLKYLSFNLLRNFYKGIDRIKKGGYQKLLGSIIFSNLLLSVTTISPLWYISYKWGNEYLGYFSLVLVTLVLPITLIGKAVGQVYYQKASSLMSSGESFNAPFMSNLKFLVTLSLPIFSLVFFLAPVIYPLFFGAQWLVAGYIAQYYVFAAGISFISIPLERSALVSNAWWYSPVWYIFRASSTLMVIYFVDFFESSFYEFIFWLTIQVALMHLIDVFASYKFSLRNKPYQSNLF